MIDNKLITEIKEYCVLNECGNYKIFVNKLLKKAFTMEKYGSLNKKEPIFSNLEVNDVDNNKECEEIVEKKVAKVTYEYEKIIGELKKQIDNLSNSNNKSIYRD